MKTHRIAYRYCGYLVERAVAFDDDIDALDLSETVEHFWSSGPCEPIVSSGMGPKWRIDAVNLPDWASVERYADDIHVYGGKVRTIMALDNCDRPEFARLIDLDGLELDAVVALLRVKSFRSSFMLSLRSQVDNWLSGNGQYTKPLSYKQLNCVIRAYHIRTR